MNLLQQAEDDEEQHRIQRSAEELQPVKSHSSYAMAESQRSTVVCCSPTFPPKKKHTCDFSFRGGIRQHPPVTICQLIIRGNKWLVQETADFLPEVLEQLKAGGLLKPAFFDVLPVKSDSVPAEFDPIAEALKKAMRESPFVPTQDGGYAKAESVFYPRTESLRQLIESSWLQPDSSWLHPDIQDTEKFRQRFEVMREAGVTKVRFPQVLDWFEKQTPSWFEGRPNEWLCSLYVYLKGQHAELERIKKLPLVRLENGRHVCAGDQLVFFPPDTDEDREEIKPFLNELSILMSALLEGG